jgi:hypothetical protein
MNPKKENSKVTKMEEPAVVYESSKMKSQGIDRDTFNFDEEFKKGYTPEQFKEEMFKRINAYPWKK